MLECHKKYDDKSWTIQSVFLLPGRGCCGCTCHRWQILNGQSSPWWCKTWLRPPHLSPDHSIQTWSTPCRRPMAAGVQTEACSPNTGGDSSPTRPGGAAAGLTQVGDGRAAGCTVGPNYTLVGSWCDVVVSQFRIVWLLTKKLPLTKAAWMCSFRAQCTCYMSTSICHSQTLNLCNILVFWMSSFDVLVSAVSGMHMCLCICGCVFVCVEV